jgi:colanic acid biosynthesis protein WcaH
VLPEDIFHTIVENAPLFAIDLVVENEDGEILLGQRINPPARNWWFVPGGRVFKDETISDAFERLTKNELGSQYNINQAMPLGLYEHFYQDSVHSQSITTHYINYTHYIKVEKSTLNLPLSEQHDTYRWVTISELESDRTIHEYSKVFLPELLKKLNMEV